MNVSSNIIIRKVNLDDPGLHSVIAGSIGGYPNSHKIHETIMSYNDPFNEIIGAYESNVLLGIIGLSKADEVICIHHISVLLDYRNQGVGKFLLNYLKKNYLYNKIIAETDEESIGFYEKSGFSCNPFKGKHENIRYRCEFSAN